VAQFRSDGTLDPAFNGNGVVLLDDFDGSILSNDAGVIKALAIQKDGKIVVAGSEIQGIIFSVPFVAARLNANGSLDNSFGNDGKLHVDFDQRIQEAETVLIDYNGNAGSNPNYGKIILVGNAIDDNNHDEI